MDSQSLLILELQETLGERHRNLKSILVAKFSRYSNQRIWSFKKLFHFHFSWTESLLICYFLQLKNLGFSLLLARQPHFELLQYQLFDFIQLYPFPYADCYLLIIKRSVTVNLYLCWFRVYGLFGNLILFLFVKYSRQLVEPQDLLDDRRLLAVKWIIVQWNLGGLAQVVSSQKLENQTIY